MSQAAKARERDRKARARLRVLGHHEQVTRNVSQICRVFGISRSLFYIWRDRYREDGLVGLRDGSRGPRHHPSRRPYTSSRFEAGPQPNACASFGWRQNLFTN